MQATADKATFISVIEEVEHDIAAAGGHRVFDSTLDHYWQVESEDGSRRVSVILDPWCVRWVGYARGYEVYRMGRTPTKPWELEMSGGWTQVTKRHEFKDEGRRRCAANALRWLKK